MMDDGLPACVLGVAGTLLITLEAVVPLGAEPHLAHLARVAWLAQTHATDVVALGPIHTAACLGTGHAVRSNRALVLAPAERERQ